MLRLGLYLLGLVFGLYLTLTLWSVIGFGLMIIIILLVFILLKLIGLQFQQQHYHQQYMNERAANALEEPEYVKDARHHYALYLNSVRK